MATPVPSQVLSCSQLPRAPPVGTRFQLGHGSATDRTRCGGSTGVKKTRWRQTVPSPGAGPAAGLRGAEGAASPSGLVTGEPPESSSLSLQLAGEWRTLANPRERLYLPAVNNYWTRAAFVALVYFSEIKRDRNHSYAWRRLGRVSQPPRNQRKRTAAGAPSGQPVLTKKSK